METDESVLLVKPEVNLYHIALDEVEAIAHRAGKWNLHQPEWKKTMRVVSKGDLVTLRFEDKKCGELFAECPIEQYPGRAIEPTKDCPSRYFFLRVLNYIGKKSCLGLGFLTESDAVDLHVVLQDHFKRLENRDQIEKEKEQPKQELDLGFKEGETIKDKHENNCN